MFEQTLEVWKLGQFEYLIERLFQNSLCQFQINKYLFSYCFWQAGTVTLSSCISWVCGKVASPRAIKFALTLRETSCSSKENQVFQRYLTQDFLVPSNMSFYSFLTKMGGRKTITSRVENWNRLMKCNSLTFWPVDVNQLVMSTKLIEN